MEHTIVIKMLKGKGFHPRCRWIEDIITSATSPVLLNGVVGKEFKCKRGVRQGDPLSPLLFAIAADLLQSVINSEYVFGNISHPFPWSYDTPFPIVQYLDDTILTM